jgi:phage/conjugal plasmid C-4 type zinc finger TraR family protein
MDVFDRAQQRQAEDTEQALREHRDKVVNKPGPQLYDEEGRVICWECQEPIPDARLEAHPESAFCVECLADIERRHSRWRLK